MKSKTKKYRIIKLMLRNGEVTYYLEYRYLNLLSFIFQNWLYQSEFIYLHDAKIKMHKEIKYDNKCFNEQFQKSIISRKEVKPT